MSDLLKFTRTSLTGGGATAVDGISATALVGGELCWTMVSDIEYLYRMNATSGAAADGISIIIPVVGTVGNKRWILQRKVFGIQEYLLHDSGTIPATYLYGGQINTYGQDDNCTLTLEVAVLGMNFSLVCGTTIAKYLRIAPATGDSIYLEGATTGDNRYVGLTSAAIGSEIYFSTFTTATGVDWKCTGIGLWVSSAISPSLSPSESPSLSPSESPSLSPSASISPSLSPSLSPSESPSVSPSLSPST